ncbi:MAG: DUF4340 domain-containing protein [Gemmatimonadales bacterium]
MSRRQLAAIFGLAAVMLSGWFLLRGGGEGDRVTGGLDLGARIGSDVAYVRIDRPDEPTIELVRRADGWTVNGYPALDSLVNAALAGLDTLPAGRLISRSPANHERLGLTAETGVRVQVGPAGDPEADFLVGKEGVDGRFVRLPGSDDSYVLPAGPLDPLTGGVTDWRDFMIARVDTAALRRIEIRRGDEVTAELERPGTGTRWTVGGAPADSTLMRSYMLVLSRLEATGFPADSFVYAADFERPMATVNLYYAEAGARAPDVSLLFSTGLDHPDVLVRRADDPIVYALDRRRANLLTTTAERLRAR